MKEQIYFFLSGHKFENKSDVCKAINNLDSYKLTLNLFVSQFPGWKHDHLH